jgi:predicted nucleotidyltransferase
MTLLDIIRTNENTRRLFGKRELKIIEKQLLGVKLKPSEIVRLSRDIRKKFEAIKEISQYKEEFELKKNNETKKIVKKVKEAILNDELASEIESIILFGSVAEGKNTLLSDIDIAVRFNKITDKEAFRFRIRIGGQFGNRVDIQVYNFLPEKIKREINEHGLVIFKK